MAAFRDEVVAQHGRDHVNLLFNNAGVGGGYSFVADDRRDWDRTFAICWGGVYNCSRAFVPLLVASDAGYLVNTSSVNGFWAALGPGSPHTAYSTAKFAVKGFSEALITDFRVNAPHVKVAVVMPGHVGTGIVANTHERPRRRRVAGREHAARSPTRSRAKAPVSAGEAATIILDGVRRDEWRILVGDDARGARRGGARRSGLGLRRRRPRVAQHHRLSGRRRIQDAARCRVPRAVDEPLLAQQLGVGE